MKDQVSTNLIRVAEEIEVEIKIECRYLGKHFDESDVYRFSRRENVLLLRTLLKVGR